jgi:hypothetical protein
MTDSIFLTLEASCEIEQVSHFDSGPLYRRGGVYLWRKKVVCGEPPSGTTIALSLCVREPARARRAALLNARFLAFGDKMLTGQVKLGQSKAILAGSSLPAPPRLAQNLHENWRVPS